MLLDRAYGKAKEILELGVEGSEDEQRRRSRAMIAQLSVEERGQLRTLLETAHARAERAGEIPPSSAFSVGWTAPDPASPPRVIDTMRGP